VVLEVSQLRAKDPVKVVLSLPFSYGFSTPGRIPIKSLPRVWSLALVSQITGILKNQA
jgi:hypothetical protein